MLLDELTARLTAMPEADRQETIKLAVNATKDMKWIPNPGPQTDAYFCKADILLYGGQGGGGKSDLGLGLAFTAHKRSLILRRKYANLSALTERAIKINGTRDGFNGSPPPLLRTGDRYIQFGANQRAGDEEDWQGHAFDLKYFDEATQFLESQVRFHLGWLRSTEDGQRVRAVLGTNPPINADGDWIIGFFRPWLDLTHPKPAKHGELRWFVTAPDGADLEVAGPETIEIDGKPLKPLSRTFIPAKLSDNPFLINTNYQANLDGLPEPLRSAVRDGNFMAARSDAEYQIIPTQWIIEAQARWIPDGHKDFDMTAMAFDPAGGGRDSAEIARRHGGWFAEMISEQGESTADGSKAAGTIVSHRRDNAPVVVDVGGGYGGAVTLRLQDNHIPFVKYNGGAKSHGKALGSGLPFFNMRSDAHWRFREALDPDQEGGSPIALPPDPELRSDLATACLDPTALERGMIKVESKEDIKKRIGRSPGKGDAVIMCLTGGSTAIKRAAFRSNRPAPTVRMGHSAARARRH